MEQLNPHVGPAQMEQFAAQVDWRLAPPDAAAYIAIHVDGETHGCWVLDDGRARRVKAPSFGLQHFGDRLILRRPLRHPLDPLIIDRLAWMFWRIRGMNSRLELMAPEVGYRPPEILKRDPLARYVGAIVNRVPVRSVAPYNIPTPEREQCFI